MTLKTLVARATLCLLAGCNDTSDLAPASFDTPWQTDIARQPATPAPAGSPHRFVLPREDTDPGPAVSGSGTAPGIDPARIYDLPELIDVAERRNAATRAAWELARQAALNVGVARAAFLPSLTLQALAGYERTASPFPTLLKRRGYITANAQELLPELAVRYLLLDFGGRAATVAAARDLSFAANVEFTAAHQALILAVTRAYLTLDGTDAARAAADRSLANAAMLQDAAEQRYAHGIGTVVEVALARRGTAQARVSIADAATAQHAARLSLLAAIELPPTTVLRVRDSAAIPLARDTGVTVDRLIEDALQRRPELLADLAQARAAEQGVALARAAMLPKLAVSANVQGNIGQISVDGGPYESIAQPQAGVFLAFTWPIYSGGLLRNQLDIARSRRAAAADTLAEARENAMREVALAYDAVQDGLAQYDAALALQTASTTAFDAAGDAYRNGVGTLTDASDAQTALAAARASVARTHAQALISAAALAFSVGALSSSDAFGMPRDVPAATAASAVTDVGGTAPP